MLIKTIPVGQLETNCYVVTNEETLHCVVIDPGDESNTILDYLEDNHLVCEAILLTHGHYDHVGAVETVQEETGATVYLHEKDDHRFSGDYHFPYSLPENGKNLHDGDVLELAFLSPAGRFRTVSRLPLEKLSAGRVESLRVLGVIDAHDLPAQLVVTEGRVLRG